MRPGCVELDVVSLLVGWLENQKVDAGRGWWLLIRWTVDWGLSSWRGLTGVHAAIQEDVLLFKSTSFYCSFRCTSSPATSSTAGGGGGGGAGGGGSSGNGGLVVGYYLCDDPVPYRSQWPSNVITLGQFKHLVPKKGLFRWVASSWILHHPKSTSVVCLLACLNPEL